METPRRTRASVSSGVNHCPGSIGHRFDGAPIGGTAWYRLRIPDDPGDVVATLEFVDQQVESCRRVWLAIVEKPDRHPVERLDRIDLGALDGSVGSW